MINTRPLYPARSSRLCIARLLLTLLLLPLPTAGSTSHNGARAYKDYLADPPASRFAPPPGVTCTGGEFAMHKPYLF